MTFAAAFTRLPLLAVVACLGLCACTSRPGPSALQTVAAAADARTVKVLAGTTRARMTPDSNVFDSGKSLAANYAEMTVSIPPGHVPTQIEWPGKVPDARKTFAVVGQSVLDRQSFANAIKPAMSGSRKAGVFVHGYNYNFQEALFRVAQISADLKVDGTPILFSWPSQGAISGYVADKESATYSRDYLAALLTELAEDRGEDDITVFGHSMGGWLVVETLRQLKMQGRDDVLARLNVMLAAPDIDGDVFRTQMAVIGKMKRPMTILVAHDDRALEISKVLSASTQRVGMLDIGDPDVQKAAVESGVQLVDITGVKSSDSANHSRFADALSLYPALTAQAKKNGVAQAGAFVFDAAAATISSPFRLVSGALKQE